MELESLSIRRPAYGVNKDKLQGEVRARNGSISAPEIKIDLPEELAVQIIRLVAPILAQTVRDSLTQMADDAERAMLGDAYEAKAITSGDDEPF